MLNETDPEKTYWEQEAGDAGVGLAGGALGRWCLMRAVRVNQYARPGLRGCALRAEPTVGQS